MEWMLSPIPAGIEVRSNTFHATDRGVMSIDKQRRVKEVVARNALMLF